MRHFEKLCDTAFTPRELHNIPVLGKLAMINHSSKYKTKPLEKVLKETFSVSEQPLFGGQHTHSHSWLRTAVTSTKETGERAVLLANYNRSHEKDDQCRHLLGTLEFFAKNIIAEYWFERAELPKNELHVWEV